MTSFLALAEVVAALGKTSKRLEKRRLLAQFLRSLGREEVPAAVLLLTGSVFAESDDRVLNVGFAALQDAIAGLEPPAPGVLPLSLLDVQAQLHAVAEVHGVDSVRKRQTLLSALFAQSTPTERAVLLRSLSGEMRIGLNESGMLDALAEASGIPLSEVRAAQMLVGDLGRVGELALYGGEEAIRAVGVRVLSPIKPMLADLGEDPASVLLEHGGKTAVEYKMDGARVQIHRLGDDVRVFTRRLSDITASVPEIVELARTLPARAFIVEGELLAVDGAGRPLPFQELMRRFRRVHEIEKHRTSIPLQLHLFDVLYLDDTSLLDVPYQERFRALEGLVPPALLVERRIVSSPEDMDALLAEALRAGHEGLMAKRLDAPYAAGKRGKSWLKLKPADTLDVVLLAAEWGHGRRQGTLSNYWLGVRDGDGWQMVGKTFKGLTDAERLQLMEALLPLKTSEAQGVVHVRPQLVVEVTYNDVQKSPTYSSGFALRFARVTRIRTDKGPQDADTYARLQALYEKQFERKGRLKDA